MENIIFYSNFVIKGVNFSLFVMFKYIIFEVYFNRILYEDSSGEVRVILLKFEVFYVNIFCFVLFDLSNLRFDIKFSRDICVFNNGFICVI